MTSIDIMIIGTPFAVIFLSAFVGFACLYFNAEKY